MEGVVAKERESLLVCLLPAHLADRLPEYPISPWMTRLPERLLWRAMDTANLTGLMS